MACICDIRAIRALLSHVAVTRCPEHVSVSQTTYVINTAVETAFAL